MINMLNSIDKSTLSECDKLIYEYFISNPDKIVQNSLKEISESIYVSNASIVRFCKKIGFYGFNDFKYNYQLQYKNLSTNEDLSTIIPRNSTIIKDFLEEVNTDNINKISEILTQSKSIYIFGRDMSSIPANYLYSMLTSYDIPCIFIDWLTYLSALSCNFPENSVLFMFTNYAIDNNYFQIVENCSKRNIKIIWISTNEVCEIFQKESHYYFHLPTMDISHTNLDTKITSFVLVQLILENLIKKRYL